MVYVSKCSQCSDAQEGRAGAETASGAASSGARAGAGAGAGANLARSGGRMQPGARQEALHFSSMYAALHGGGRWEAEVEVKSQACFIAVERWSKQAVGRCWHYFMHKHMHMPLTWLCTRQSQPKTRS